jgi:hypothetical protein
VVIGNQAATHPPTIRAALTHKSEREELNPEPERTRSLTRTWQAEPENSKDEAEEVDGRFDAVATIMRVKDSARRLGRA